MYNDMSKLFTLKITTNRFSGRQIVIVVYDTNCTDATGHSRLDVVVRYDGETVFAKGDTWLGLPYNVSLDGDIAKRAACELVSMKPGDTDDEYFVLYTPIQLAFAERFGDLIACEAQLRYGDA